jgi:histidine ammonia-lyase
MAKAQGMTLDQLLRERQRRADASLREALAATVTLLRTRVAHLSDDRHIQPDMQAAIDMVKSGALLQCASKLGNTPLPGVR